MRVSNRRINGCITQKNAVTVAPIAAVPDEIAVEANEAIVGVTTYEEASEDLAGCWRDRSAQDSLGRRPVAHSIDLCCLLIAPSSR